MGNTIEVKNLVKRYKDFVALDHFSMEVKEGEIFGLLGPNGSGKTTTINCILSLLEFDKGEIKVFGREMKPSSYDIKKDIGVVMQNVAVFDEMTVYENVDYFCGLYVKDKTIRKNYVEEAIEFVGLSDYKKFLPKKLSGGLLRRLNIACGIAHKPKLIFFDEPTVAVDPQSRNKILEGIVKLNEEGATIVYTSHYMEEVEQICTRILIMDNGRQVALGTKSELKKMIKKTETISAELPELKSSDLENLKKLPHVYETSYTDGELKLMYSGGNHNLVRVMEYLKDHNIMFGRVYTESPTLNDIFLEITGKTLRD
ncbi:MAG: ABC transporter ATP-binding protein [Clostridiaceae bacterium]|nr:ABC transporter ATP-binding protein [Clostridiaceae bacterium]